LAGVVPEEKKLSQGPDPIPFLAGYKQLNENIEYSVTKQFKVDIDVFPNDLPRELAER
jgi:palmitoyltransferase